MNEKIIKYFPITPYNIQIQIASLIFKILSQGIKKVIVIQSPTGTGKTYSLLAPIIAWLIQNPTKIKKQQLANNSTPSWLKKPSQQKGIKLLDQKRRSIFEMSNLQKVKQLINKKKNQKNISLKNNKLKQQFDQFGQSQQSQQESLDKKKHISKLDIMIQRQMRVDNQNILPKLIFVSKTHSQLSQVMNSIRSIMKQNLQLKYLQIGSKEHLCINKQINSHKNNISQKCQYLLDHSKCQFNHQISISNFFNLDMIETKALGQKNEICPYFASRKIMDYADILCVPYASILNPQIRNKLGININNSIIVFDEGHNLLQNEKQMHSMQINISQINIFCQKIDEYLGKFSNKLSPKHNMLLSHLLQILRSFIRANQYFKRQKKQEFLKNKYYKVKFQQILKILCLKQMKIQKIIKYFTINNVDKKLSYFISKNIQNTKNNKQNISPNTIMNILNFLYLFAQFKIDKQVILLKQSSIKILCLQNSQIINIIQKSRLCIIAGGTMQPLNDLKQILQRWPEKDEIHKYNHIVKKQNCKIKILKNYKNKDLNFNFKSWSDNKQLFNQAIKQIIKNITQKTQKGGGIVIFIQNYELVNYFKVLLKEQKYYSYIIFDQKQKKQNQCQDIFQNYKRKVQTDKQNNYYLISVMNGKLSQGINFSDNLARSLVVFGLPFPNKNSPQILQNMKHIDQKQYKDYNGKIYYQNLCYKTLNQTIGRGIRHINDYVQIYLIDSRFQNIKQKLSQWMRPNIQIINDFSYL